MTFIFFVIFLYNDDCCAGWYFDFLFSCHLVLNLFPFPLSSDQRVGMCYNNKGYAAFPFLFLMQRQCSGAIFHACAMKGSAAYGKKSAKEMKIHILALLVPGASSQAQLGDSAQLRTVRNVAHLLLLYSRTCLLFGL